MNTCISLLVCIMVSASFNVPVHKAKSIAKYVCKYSDQYNIKKRWPISVMKLETKFHHFTKPNKTQDIGIMQLHCPNKEYAQWCRMCNIKKLWCNIKMGIYHMHYHKSKCTHITRDKTAWLRHYNWNNPRHYQTLKRISRIYLKRKNECSR